MDIMEWIKKNAALLLTGAVGLLAGAMLFGHGDEGLSKLEQKLAARMQNIDSKLETLGKASGKLGELEQKLTALDKASAPLSGKVGALSAQMKKLGAGIAAMKSASIEQMASTDKRMSALQAKLAEFAEFHEKMKSRMARMAMSAAEPAAGAKAVAAAPANRDGVRLTIGQSAWLVDNKLNVTLAYIYPGNKSARVGMNGHLYELRKAVPEDFEFDGKRCALEFVGVEDGKAIIKQNCGS